MFRQVVRQKTPTRLKRQIEQHGRVIERRSMSYANFFRNTCVVGSDVVFGRRKAWQLEGILMWRYEELHFDVIETGWPQSNYRLDAIGARRDCNILAEFALCKKVPEVADVCVELRQVSGKQKKFLSTLTFSQFETKGLNLHNAIHS